MRDLLRLSSSGKRVLGWSANSGLALVENLAGSTETSYERLEGLFRRSPVPLFPMADPDKKRQTMVLRHLSSWKKVDE